MYCCRSARIFLLIIVVFCFHPRRESCHLWNQNCVVFLCAFPNLGPRIQHGGTKCYLGCVSILIFFITARLKVFPLYWFRFPLTPSSSSRPSRQFIIRCFFQESKYKFVWPGKGGGIKLGGGAVSRGLFHTFFLPRKRMLALPVSDRVCLSSTSFILRPTTKKKAQFWGPLVAFIGSNPHIQRQVVRYLLSHAD